MKIEVKPARVFRFDLARVLLPGADEWMAEEPMDPAAKKASSPSGSRTGFRPPDAEGR